MVRCEESTFGCLGAAPILPGTLFWVFVGLTSDRATTNDLLIAGAFSIFLAMCWFIGVGSLFLFWVGRRYGQVERFTCLALCGTLAFSLPLLSSLIWITEDAGESLGAILVGAIIGLVFTPLGMFGGWVLWRIAIRPAAIPLREMADVF